MNRLFGFSIFLALVTLSCTGGGTPQKTDNPPLSQDAQQQTPQNWTGDGGKGMSLAILAPKLTNLAESENYLIEIVKNEFVHNFDNYSAIDVQDFDSLGDVYAALFSGYYNDDAGSDLGHLTETTYIMGGSITKTATGYSLDMKVTKNADKMTAASYSGTFSFAELDNRTGIRRASLELLQKMGVTLTAQGREELAGAAAQNQVSRKLTLQRALSPSGREPKSRR
jgi:hypothetical protein